MGCRGSDSSPRWTVERCWASGPTQSLIWPLSWCNCYSYYQMWDRVNPEQGFINARNTLLCQNFNESFHFEAKGLARNWHPFLKYPWKSLLLKKSTQATSFQSLALPSYPAGSEGLQITGHCWKPCAQLSAGYCNGNTKQPKVHRSITATTADCATPGRAWLRKDLILFPCF